MRIKEYLKDNIKWIIVILIITVTTAGLLAVNNISISEILYAVGISLFVAATVLVYDWNNYRIKINLL